MNHLQLMFWFFVLTALSILFIAPLYKTWHANMRQRDDRESSGIFHEED